MRADNSHHLIDASRRRAQVTYRSAVAALRRMDNSGRPITFDALAREANVSRSWLYNQPELRAEIERLRDQPRPAAGRLVPDRQRSSDASLLRRVEVATQRIRELETDNKRLRHALAEALGERRTAPSHKPHRDTPEPRVSPPITAC
ncbi:MAG: transposase [Pseudonocardiales bacterium]|nr:MAG: transposase [Pseudonocardiales bacterium]